MSDKPKADLFGNVPGVGLYACFPVAPLRALLKERRAELSSLAAWNSPAGEYEKAGKITHLQFLISESKVKALRKALSPYFDFNLKT